VSYKPSHIFIKLTILNDKNFLGHNPTEDLCSKLWGGRIRMNFSEFEKILDSLDPVPSEEDLVEIFRYCC
jgi:hypothetical protein